MKKMLLLGLAALTMLMTSCERLIEDIALGIAVYVGVNIIDGLTTLSYRSCDSHFDGRAYWWDGRYYFTTDAGFSIAVSVENYGGRYHYSTDVVTVLPIGARYLDYDLRLRNHNREIEIDSWGEKTVIRLVD